MDKLFKELFRLHRNHNDRLKPVQVTEPPIFYMIDVSRAIVALIVEYNRISSEAGAGSNRHTYDAGPNTIIYTL